MPFNRFDYPDNWPDIRADILRRAGGCDDDPRVGASCERCGVRNYAVGTRGDMGAFAPVVGNLWLDDFRYATSYREARETAQAHNEWDDDGRKYIVIVLTVAHLDHDTQNNDPANLVALCQRCHLAHDAAHHARNAAATRRAKRAEAGQMELFEEIL